MDIKLKHQKITLVLSIIISCLLTNNGLSAQWVTLKNDQLTVEIGVGDDSLAKTFGPRFDQSARVRSVLYQGKQYLHPNGLCDEYGVYGLGVLGYDEAKSGDHFIKIGVGVLERTDQRYYACARKFRVHKLFSQHTQSSTNTLTVTQESSTVAGYAYHMQKTYRIKGSELSIIYLIQNTGKHPFSFEQYSHNWFAFEQRPIDENVFFKTDFDLPNLPFTWLVQNQKRWHFKFPISAKEYRFMPLFQAIPIAQSSVILGDLRSGQRAILTGDFALSRFSLYAQADAICPERFVTKHLQPGQQTQWTRTYRFE